MKYDAETLAQVWTTYNNAIQWMELVYDSAEFAQYLRRLTLVNFDNGCFVIEAPNQFIGDMLLRHSENLIIKNAFKTCAPKHWGVEVTVEFVFQVTQSFVLPSWEGVSV